MDKYIHVEFLYGQHYYRVTSDGKVFYRNQFSIEGTWHPTSPIENYINYAKVGNNISIIGLIKAYEEACKAAQGPKHPVEVF